MAGHGPDESDRVIVGEAPGKEEVLRGKPFVGKAGRRLDLALSAAQIDRRSIYITNALMCYPPGKPPRPPKQAVDACRKRLIDEINQRKPRKVLALGATAAKALISTPIIIDKVRQRDLPSHYLDGHIKVRATYHPSALTGKPGWPGGFDDDVRWLGEP